MSLFPTFASLCSVLYMRFARSKITCIVEVISRRWIQFGIVRQVRKAAMTKAVQTLLNRCLFRLANKTCQFLLVPHRKSSTVHCTLIRLGKTPYIKTNKACNKMRLCNQFHLPMTEYAPIDFSKVKFKPVFEWPEGVTPVVS